jgi:hypothetical protein
VRIVLVAGMKIMICSQTLRSQSPFLQRTKQIGIDELNFAVRADIVRSPPPRHV